MGRVRVLLSDGSGLTARQSATRLAAAGHQVGVLTGDPLALSRFTRHVTHRHRVPPYGTGPFAWLDAALEAYAAGRYDVLLPTQEQVAVLARAPGRLAAAGVVTAVPPFAALSRVQDKVSAGATLAGLGLPQPESSVVTTAADLAGWDGFPVFVKVPIGTATTGVTRVGGRAAMVALAATLDAEGTFAGSGVVVQSPVAGDLAMVQAVFAHGSLVALHANLRVREGANGGASHKRSIDVGPVRALVETLGGALGWHGALSVDVIIGDDGPRCIDVNPRLVEPQNAWFSGVDLVGALLEVAVGGTPVPRPSPVAGVGTHQLLLSVLGAAQHVGTRRAVLTELTQCRRHGGAYADSVEELTPIGGDLRTMVPVAAAAAATLVRPAWWSAFASGAVSSYALTPAGWDEILAGPPGRATV